MNSTSNHVDATDYFTRAEIPAKQLADRRSRFSTKLCDVELVTVSKELVETLLRGNINNRPVNQSNLNKLISEFSSGRYRFTGEPIIRDEYGKLRDGQHRLLALRAANYPAVPIVVTTLKGEKSAIEEAYDKMNTGWVRKFGTLLQHKGVENPLKVASLCKKIPYIATGYSSFPVQSDSYYLSVMSLYRKEIEAVAPLLRTRGLKADMGAAACVIAKVTGCLEEIVELLRKAIANDMLRVGSPEHTLNKVINDNLRAVKKGQSENSFTFAVTAHAIIAYLNRENYPVVNKNIRKALKWISDMAEDNNIYLLPKPSIAATRAA